MQFLFLCFGLGWSIRLNKKRDTHLVFLSPQVCEDGGSRAGATKKSEDPASPTNSTAPQVATAANASADSSEVSCEGGSIPSCYAPLQLKIGIARQGGNHSLTKQHPVAPSEGFKSGDTRQPRLAPQKFSALVDQFPKSRSSPQSFPKSNLPPGHLPSSRITASHQLEGDEKTVHKKRKSVIRGTSKFYLGLSCRYSFVVSYECSKWRY